MYYAYKSRDGHIYCMKAYSVYEVQDELLFDTVEDCVAYWRKNGFEIDRFCF